MNPRVERIYIEMVTVLGAPVILLGTGVVRVDLANPLVDIVMFLWLVWAVRVLWKLRSLASAGVDVDDEFRKSPLLYHIDRSAAGADHEWQRRTAAIQWGIAVV